MPPQPVYNLKEPLMLLGTCNEWEPTVAARTHPFKAGLATRTSVESSLKLELPSGGEVSFQVVSVRHGWAWRLYPAADRELVDRRHALGARLAAGENSQEAHGKNFLVRGDAAEVVDIRISLRGDAKHPSICLWCTRLPRAGAGSAQGAHDAQMPVPKGAPGVRGPASAASRVVRPAAAAQASLPKKPLVPRYPHEELGPLRLVGEFCGWQLEVPGLCFEYIGDTGDPAGGQWHEHRLGLRLQSPQIKFQIVSELLGFRWRLFPAAGTAGRLQRGSFCREAWIGGEKDGHDMNFAVQEAASTCLTLVVRLRSAKAKAPPSTAEVIYNIYSGNNTDGSGFAQAPQVEIGEGKVRQLRATQSKAFSDGPEEVAWSNDPTSFSLDRLEPLRLVGQPCDWRLEQRGLLFKAAEYPDLQGWRAHELCFRMLTRQVDFQVVSDRLGFQWRLFPEKDGEASVIPKGTDPKAGLEAKLGGKDDGHGRNFRVRGAPLRVVTVTVWLEERRKGSAAPTTGKATLTYQIKDKGLQVAIGAAKVQCPPRTVTPLGPELLEMAETQEEKDKVLEMRYALIRKLCWQLQKEYLAEDVQSEVLALRKLYPYRQQKGALALEMDAAMQAPKALAQEAAFPASGAGAAAQPGDDSSVTPGVEAPPVPAVEPSAEEPKEPQQEQREETAATVANAGEGAAEAKPQLSFFTREGVGLAHGGDIWNGRMTLEEAKVACEHVGHCCGFCFEGDAQAGPVDVYFKDKWEPVDPCEGWTAVGVRERFEGEVAAAATEGDDRKWRCVLGLAVIQSHVQEAQATMGLDNDAGAAGAKEAHLQLMKRQQKNLSKMLADSGAAQEIHQSLFGNTEQQFNTAVQHLPSVKAARARAMKKVNLPQDLALSAIHMGEQRHELDMAVNEANQLTMKRLRVHSSPHPATMAAAAQALNDVGFFAGFPPDWFWGLDTSVHADWAASRAEVERCWNAGRFKHWFGGPKAGRYMITSSEELWDWSCPHLFSKVILVKDQLKLLIAAMGDEGNNLEVEQRVLLAYHANGDMLPPWEDAAGKRSRRLTLTFHLSTGHFKISEGGALRLHRSRDERKSAAGGEPGADGEPTAASRRSGLVAEVPGGGGHWCVFRTHEFKQEISKVRLPNGRWCVTVCAEDREVLKEQLKQQQRFGGRGLELAECSDNFMASMEMNCDRCGFAAGDGVLLTCPGSHRICRACMQREIRREAVPTCPACASNGDRVHVTEDWQLFDSPSLDNMGCVCPEEAVDPGSRVIIFGFHKDTQLNGKVAEAIWWDEDSHTWEMRVFATGKVIHVHPGCCQLAECCQAGSELPKCPCWPGGRGVYPVSLGNRCCSKLGIDECTGPVGAAIGYPLFHGIEFMPFDSILTKLEAVLYFLRHNFDNFYHYNNCLDVSPAGYPLVVFHNYRSTIHSWPHHHPTLDQGKLERRVDRFRLLCRHARDVRGARTMLFIRFVGSSEEFGMIEELYSLLRLWAGSRVRLFVVCMLQRMGLGAKKELLRHERFPRVLYWMVGRVQVLDFSPIREALRFAVFDEAGLLDCKTISTAELQRDVRPFTDPYTTQSSDCVETWLLPLNGRDPAFFPDCPRAQLPNQGRERNQDLRHAVHKGDLVSVQKLLRKGNADPNTWDADGRTPLHDLCDFQRCGPPTPRSLELAAELVLAHGDPRCHDRSGMEARHLLRCIDNRSAKHARQLRALLDACALAEEVDSEALYSSLEVLGEPTRSRLSRILGLNGLRPLGEAELAWRNPPPDSEAIITQVEEELRTLERLPEAKRKREMKRLLLEWHPDKNAERLSLATTVFQFLQAQKASIIGR